MKDRAFLLIIFFVGASLNVTIAQTAPARADNCSRLNLSNPTDTAKESGPTSASTEIARTAPDDSIIKVNTDLVVAEFDVRDKRGKRVTGLAPSDFRIEEDGVAQSIEIFSYGKASANIGRSIILIIDHSQSQSPYMETSIDAAKVLVDMLELTDRMAIVTDDVELLVNFTSDKSILKSRLDDLKTRALTKVFGKSRQLTALHVAVTELFEVQDKRPIVILQTDGDEFAAISSSPIGRGQPICSGTLRKFSDLEETLEKAGTTIYSVIPGVQIDSVGDNENLDVVRGDLEKIVQRETKLKMDALSGSAVTFSRKSLRDWARGRLRDAAAVERLSILTGGISQYLDSPQRAGEVYRRILDEMNQRYLIGYYPTNSSHDGKKRTIKISTRSGLEYTIIGRTSYVPTGKAASQ